MHLSTFKLSYVPTLSFSRSHANFRFSTSYDNFLSLTNSNDMIDIDGVCRHAL